MLSAGAVAGVAGASVAAGKPAGPAAGPAHGRYFAEIRRTAYGIPHILAWDFVAGYNRYLRDTGTAHLPDPTCRGASWVSPITALDIWTLNYNFDQVAGADQFRTATAPSRQAARQVRGQSTLSDIAGRRPAGV